MRLSRAAPACLVAAAVSSAMLAAQATPPAPQQQPTFRAATNLVRVDVTVLDKHGTPLTDLTRNDFVVTEDGVPQTIEAFRFIEANGQPTDDLSLPIRSRDHAYAEAARDDVRVFVVFWDEYHIGQFEPAIRGRAALTDLVLHAFGPTDLVAITDQLTPSDAIEFTRDRRALAETVAKLKGRRGVYLPPRSVMEEAQLYRQRDIEGVRSQVSRSALEATVGFLGTIKEGRKAVLLVTEDFGPMGAPADQADWLRDFIREANQNNTAVYTFDPRGLGLMDDVLMSISAETGAGRRAQQRAGEAPASHGERNQRVLPAWGGEFHLHLSTFLNAALPPPPCAEKERRWKTKEGNEVEASPSSPFPTFLMQPFLHLLSVFRLPVFFLSPPRPLAGDLHDGACRQLQLLP